MTLPITRSTIVFSKSRADHFTVHNGYGSDTYVLLSPLKEGYVSTRVNGIKLYEGVASPGMLRLVAPGETWTSEVKRSFPLLRLEIPGAIWRKLLARHSLRKERARGPLVRPLNTPVSEVERLARVLVTSPDLQTNNEQLLSEGVTQSLLAFLLHHAKQDVTVFQKGTLSVGELNRAMRFARESLPSGIKLDTWAKHVGLPRHTFVRAFKRSTGMAPYVYFLDLRIDEAKRLLETTSDAIASISHRVGFANQSHLGLVFRRKTGMSPLEWRRHGPPVRKAESRMNLDAR